MFRGGHVVLLLLVVSLDSIYRNTLCYPFVLLVVHCTYYMCSLGHQRALASSVTVSPYGSINDKKCLLASALVSFTSSSE